MPFAYAINYQVVSDGQNLTLFLVDLESNNANNSDYAKTGDIITLTIKGNENLDASSSTVTILGRNVAFLQHNADTITCSVTVQSDDPEGAVQFFGIVADTAGNTLTFDMENITISTVTVLVNAPIITSLVITGGNSVNNDHYVTNNDSVNINLITYLEIQDLTTQLEITPSLVQINGVNLATLGGKVTTIYSGNLDIDFIVDDGYLLSDGAITISITITDLAGNTATYYASDTGDFSTVIVDNSAPVVVSAIVSGGNTITIIYDDVMEASTIAASDFTLIDVNPGGIADIRTTIAATNSDSKVVLLTFSGDAVVVGTIAKVTIGTTITNQVAIAPTSVINPQSVAAGSTTFIMTNANPIIVLTDDIFISTIIATGVTAPRIDLSSLFSDGKNAEFPPHDITITTSLSTVTFAADTVASELPSDEIISIQVSTKTATEISGDIGTIIEFGDPNFDIQFTLPVRITLPDKATGNAFYINTAGVTTPITTVCTADTLTAATAQLLTPTTECRIDVGSDLVIWTLHFSGFGTGGGFTASTVSTDSGGGSGFLHYTRPTFGLDHQSYRQIVDNGFTHNLNIFNITHNWHTPFDIQNITLGEYNTFSAKTYAPYKLKLQEFIFGIPGVGEAHKAELDIEVWYNVTGGIDETKIIQKTDVVDIDSLTAFNDKVKCQESDSAKRCYLTIISVKFLEPLKDDVMAIKAVDFNRRSQTTYLNEGFDISGTSLNPMITQDIAGTEKYEGLILITQTAKYSNIWISDDGRIFESNQFGSLSQINQTITPREDPGEAKTRLHSEFTSKVSSEAEQAQIMLVEMCPSCTKPSFAQLHESYEYVHIHSNTEAELQELLISERIRAEYTLVSMLKEIYPDNPYYKEYFKQK